MLKKRFLWYFPAVIALLILTWFPGISFIALADDGSVNLFSQEDVPAPPGDMVLNVWNTERHTESSIGKDGYVDFYAKYHKIEEFVAWEEKIGSGETREEIASITWAAADLELYIGYSESWAKNYFSYRVSSERSHLKVLSDSKTYLDEATEYAFSSGWYRFVLSGTRYDYDLQKFILYKNAVIYVQGLSKGEADANSYCDYLEAQGKAMVDRKGFLVLKTSSSQEVVPGKEIPIARAVAAGAAATIVAATSAIMLVRKNGDGGDLKSGEDTGKTSDEDKEFEELLEPGGSENDSDKGTQDSADDKIGDTDYDEGEDKYKGGTEEKAIGDTSTDEGEEDGSSKTESEDADTEKNEEATQDTEQEDQLEVIARIGDVQILRDQNTGKTVISGSTVTISREKDLYGITTDGKIVHYNTETGEFKIADATFTLEKDGTTYTLTEDNKIIQYDPVEKVGKISDGRFTLEKDGTTYTLTEDNKIIQYDPVEKVGKITDGHFTLEKDGTTYTLTKDNKIIQYDPVGKVGKISDGRFTFEKDGTMYTVTKDDFLFQYDKSTGKLKISDGCTVLENQGEMYTFTKDNIVIKYDTERGVGSIASPHNTFIFGKGGQFGTAVSLPGHIEGKKVTFDIGFERYLQDDSVYGDNSAQKWWVGIKAKNAEIRYEKYPNETITKVRIERRWK